MKSFKFQLMGPGFKLCCKPRSLRVDNWDLQIVSTITLFNSIRPISQKLEQSSNSKPKSINSNICPLLGITPSSSSLKAESMVPLAVSQPFSSPKLWLAQNKLSFINLLDNCAVIWLKSCLFTGSHTFNRSAFQLPLGLCAALVPYWWLLAAVANSNPTERGSSFVSHLFISNIPPLRASPGSCYSYFYALSLRILLFEM